MRIAIFLGLLLSQFLLSTLVCATSFNAFVDRQQVFFGETFTLTLESDELTYFVEPDISPLKQEFELLSSQRNGSKPGSAPFIQWQFKLRPKLTGTLTIPSLSFGQLNSNPVVIQVKHFQRPADTSLEPVYIDSHVDREQVYMQAQVLLTRRIYHSIPLYASGQLSALSMPDARVEQLGKPRTFEQFINGVRHGVIEIRYAVFPQKTGELLIPAQSFSATLAGHDPSSLEPPSDLPGQHIEVNSAQIPISVLPLPDEYPKDAVWLPASQLEIKQEWSPANLPLNAGQALTRTLRIRAQGLPAASIAELLPKQQDDLYLYSNPVQSVQTISEQGIINLHTEQQAIVAEHSGLYEIPAIRLTWWNTETDRLEHSMLESYTLNVLEPQHSFRLSRLMTLRQELWLWQIISLVLGTACILLSLLWWRARRMPAVQPSSSINNSRLMENLKRACHANNPVQARAALDALARQTAFTPNEAAQQSSSFQEALTELNSVLYTESEQPWYGEKLWQAVLKLDRPASSETENLPPLYPS